MLKGSGRHIFLLCCLFFVAGFAAEPLYAKLETKKNKSVKSVETVESVGYKSLKPRLHYFTAGTGVVFNGLAKTGAVGPALYVDYRPWQYVSMGFRSAYSWDLTPIPTAFEPGSKWVIQTFQFDFQVRGWPLPASEGSKYGEWNRWLDIFIQADVGLIGIWRDQVPRDPQYSRSLLSWSAGFGARCLFPINFFKSAKIRKLLNRNVFAELCFRFGMPTMWEVGILFGMRLPSYYDSGK